MLIDSSSDEDNFPDLQELLRSLPSKPPRTASPTKDDANPYSTPARCAKVMMGNQSTIADSEEESPWQSAREIPSSNDTFRSATSRISALNSSPTHRVIASIASEPMEGRRTRSSSDGQKDMLGVTLQVSQLLSSSATSSTAVHKHQALELESLTTVMRNSLKPISMNLEADSSDDETIQISPRRRDLVNNSRNARSRGRYRKIIHSDTESDSYVSIEVLSDIEDDTVLTYSPPRRSPVKVNDLQTWVIPVPATPSKIKRKRIPRSPHRESAAAFWDESESTAWVEQHTPRKAMFAIPSSTLNWTVPSPATSVRSPKRKTAIEVHEAKARKDFLSQRQGLAREFLLRLIEVVCPELPARLLQPIEITWSKTLTSTAGRATYSKGRNVANIELSEKVIDSEERLHSTMAHELCHILVWVIDGQFKAPHGREFKAFGSKIEDLLGIPVDTTHDYKIHYKYQWRCSGDGCSKIYGRHSKSIDPSKVLCGICHGKLVQILPKPRAAMTPADQPLLTPGTPSKHDGLHRYQTFLKANLERVRMQNPQMKYGEIVKLIAAEFRESKRSETPAPLKTTEQTLILDMAGLALS